MEPSGKNRTVLRAAVLFPSHILFQILLSLYSSKGKGVSIASLYDPLPKQHHNREYQEQTKCNVDRARFVVKPEGAQH